jgi:hypothetical protein
MLLLALMVLIVAFGFVYAYKYTDIFSQTTENGKILAKPSGSEEVLSGDKEEVSESENSTNETLEGKEENITEDSLSEENTDSENSMINDNNDSSENNTDTNMDASVSSVKPVKPAIPVKTTEEVVLEKAEEILEEIAEKPEYVATDLCKTPANPTESGRIVFPIDEKYSNLKFLGQVFTAAKCGDERLFSIWGISGENYTLGSSLNLIKKPSKELVTSLEDIGYECSDNVEKADCMTWRLSREVKVKSLVILEPFIEYMASDDCFLCG